MTCLTLDLMFGPGRRSVLCVIGAYQWTMCGSLGKQTGKGCGGLRGSLEWAASSEPRHEPQISPIKFPNEPLIRFENWNRLLFLMENNDLLGNLIGKACGLLGSLLGAELLPISRPISRRLSQSSFPISRCFHKKK